MEATRRATGWLIQLFMAGVTAVMLAMAFGAMAHGLASAPATMVYALTAAFGLEYLISARAG